MKYNMEDFLESCVKRYEELSGGNARLRAVNTPFLPEGPKEGPAGRPASSEFAVECPWCQHTFAIEPHRVRGTAPRKHKTPDRGPDLGGRVEAGAIEQQQRGALQPIAAKVHENPARRTDGKV